MRDSTQMISPSKRGMPVKMLRGLPDALEHDSLGNLGPSDDSKQKYNNNTK